MTEIKRRAERLEQALLTLAFTGNLSKKFRRACQFEEPDYAALTRHYRVKGLGEGSAGIRTGTAGWYHAFDRNKREFLRHLSEFQEELLRIYLEANAPMPIHIAFKQLSKEHTSLSEPFSIQDAITAVKMLEGAGFLEKTIPEKIHFAGNPVTDSRGEPITIPKYQISYKD